MERVRAVGILLTTVSCGGYVIGVLASYPGRAFSITGLMVGLTLYAIGGAE